MATEPFATGLFVCKEGGQWKAFLLDFEDDYRPIEATLIDSEPPGKWWLEEAIKK